MIDEIYLDMDQVLCDYDYWLDFHNARKSNGKSDWDKLEQIGSIFWSSMPWLQEGKLLYNEVLKYCTRNSLKLGILSAVGLECGKQGKYLWLKKNCPEVPLNAVILANKGNEKYLWAKSNILLIDDRKSICESFTNAGGCAIQYLGNNINTMKEIKNLIGYK